MNNIIETAGFFILNKNRELLICHPSNHPKYYWSITKGKIEDGETYFNAAIRETFEECNINLDSTLKFIELAPVTFKNNRKRLYSYLFLAEDNANFNLDLIELKCNSDVPIETYGYICKEMDKFRWVSIHEVKTKYTIHESQLIILAEIEKILKNR